MQIVIVDHSRTTNDVIHAHAMRAEKLNVLNNVGKHSRYSYFATLCFHNMINNNNNDDNNDNFFISSTYIIYKSS